MTKSKRYLFFSLHKTVADCITVAMANVSMRKANFPSKPSLILL
ncbi:hypothetical protein VIC_001497 [Vibrio coralliilyticus ATCC BAA-450]|nr:hypothetical protein VIC_001497 [Vibrio coralliilyticus ATCC BAA-450]